MHVVASRKPERHQIPPGSPGHSNIFLEKLSSDVFTSTPRTSRWNTGKCLFTQVLRVVSHNCYYPGTVPGQDSWTRERPGASLCGVNNQIRRTGVPARTRIQWTLFHQPLTWQITKKTIHEPHVALSELLCAWLPKAVSLNNQPLASRGIQRVHIPPIQARTKKKEEWRARSHGAKLDHIFCHVELLTTFSPGQENDRRRGTLHRLHKGDFFGVGVGVFSLLHLAQNLLIWVWTWAGQLGLADVVSWITRPWVSRLLAHSSPGCFGGGGGVSLLLRRGTPLCSEIRFMVALASPSSFGEI